MNISSKAVDFPLLFPRGSRSLSRFSPFHAIFLVLRSLKSEFLRDSPVKLIFYHFNCETCRRKGERRKTFPFQNPSGRPRHAKLSYVNGESRFCLFSHVNAAETKATRCRIIFYCEAKSEEEKYEGKFMVICTSEWTFFFLRSPPSGLRLK